MITYEQIQKANQGLDSIELKGKDYVMVPQRVRAFRMLFPEGFITTDILSLENGVCTMRTEVGYYDGERRVVLATGMAYEKETNGFVNRTSYIENCETSSVGRALGFLALGIDGGGICSAEELVNAVNNQNNPKTGKTSSRKTESINAEERPEPKPAEAVPAAPVYDLADIRTKLDAAIKEKTKDMDRAGKLQFLNTVVTPTLDGERNWKLCDNPQLLMKLLAAVA